MYNVWKKFYIINLESIICLTSNNDINWLWFYEKSIKKVIKNQRLISIDNRCQKLILKTI